MFNELNISASTFIILLIVFYFTIKFAVKSGVKEACDKGSRVSRGRDGKMSKVLERLIGEKCVIIFEDEFEIDGRPFEHSLVTTILEVDEEWVKISYEGKKEEVKTDIVRIEHINKVKLNN